MRHFMIMAMPLPAAIANANATANAITTLPEKKTRGKRSIRSTTSEGGRVAVSESQGQEGRVKGARFLLDLVLRDQNQGLHKVRCCLRRGGFDWLVVAITRPCRTTPAELLARAPTFPQGYLCMLSVSNPYL